MPDKTTSKIEFEIKQIDQLLKTYAEQITTSQRREPNLIEVTALASVLHSFYNGLENIFATISKEIDQNSVAGHAWHRDLLNQMAQPSAHRSPVLLETTVDSLTGYLGFRHFYRHSYSFFLDWPEMEPLIVLLNPVWKQVKAELTKFLESLDRDN